MRTIYAFLLLAMLCMGGCSKDDCPEIGCLGDASLSSLSVSGGTLSPAFSSTTTVYMVRVPGWLSAVQVTATAVDANARILIKGVQVASGAPSEPIMLSPGRPSTIEVSVQGQGGAQYDYDLVVLRTPIDAYLKASNTGVDDSFGLSVAVSGDTMAVAAVGEDSNAMGVGGAENNETASSSGAVYVFTRSGAVWSQQAYIKASNAAANDNFGVGVALSGDTLVVGASGEDSNATGIDGDQTNNSASNSGAVYVFTRSGAVWSQQAYVKASNTGANDNFGVGVALSGDTLVVGAPGESSSATGVGGDPGNNGAGFSGAVYAFTRSGSVWSQQAYIKASNTRANDRFGFNVALSGDTLAVAAPFEGSNATGVGGDQGNNGAGFSGAVYAFTRSGSVWSQQAYVKASNTGADDNFGFGLALSGDTLAVGAINEDSNATGAGGDQANNGVSNSGAVYVFARSGSVWSQQAYIKASNTGAGDQFGFSVVLFGDMLVVGAPFESSNGTGIDSVQNNDIATNSGAAYVFTRSGAQWRQQTYLKAFSTGAGDQFGSIMALSEGTLVVGAGQEDSSARGVGGDQENNGASNSGAVYVIQ